MTRVLVVNAFERGNRGDAALLSVLLDQTRRALPGARIAIAGFEHPERWPEFDGAPNLGSIRRYSGEEHIPRFRRILRKLSLLPVVALAAVRPPRRLLLAAARLLPAEPRRELQALATADLVVSLGGGYLNGRADFASDLNILFLLLPLWLAERFGVRVVAGPQSYGPFPRRLQRVLVRHVLGRADAVLVREDISRERLTEIGLPPHLLTRGVDSAFAFETRSDRDWRTTLGIPADARIAIITARQWLDEAGQRRYEHALATGVRHLLGRGYHVVLVPQVTCAFQGDDDRRTNTRLAAGIDDPRLRVLRDDTFDHRDARALYAEADLVIGTRFHSVIFALTAHVPCLAIEYDHKTTGIMRDLGLERWVVGIDEVRAATLPALVDSLIEHRDGYLRQLREVLPPYARRARDVSVLLDAA
ncbi:polysaccharide pyruvyl transferase family protein [Amycolatopsis sp. WGS_07]|uniref:polysaccharide pyruvyl transferase family protein n=1 Tax=Amycolatopsis sp. WGS_07 TaxID=3076764 RepID=UPI0038735D7D